MVLHRHAIISPDGTPERNDTRRHRLRLSQTNGPTICPHPNLQYRDVTLRHGNHFKKHSVRDSPRRMLNNLENENAFFDKVSPYQKRSKGLTSSPKPLLKTHFHHGQKGKQNQLQHLASNITTLCRYFERLESHRNVLRILFAAIPRSSRNTDHWRPLIVSSKLLMILS